MSINSVAQNLINLVFANQLVVDLELGESATYRKTDAGTYDSSTGGFTGETNTDVTIKVIKTDFSDAEIRNSAGEIQTTDIKLYILPVSGVSFQEYSNDKIIYAGKTYRIKKVMRKTLGSTDMVYIIQVGVENGWGYQQQD